MRLEKVKLSKIKPYPNNPRANEDAVNAVMESISQCGYCAPIVVDENYMILAGHTRFKALKKLKWTECEIVCIDGLTDEQKRKYRLLDNQAGHESTWDIGKLSKELEGLDFNGFDFGFDDLFAEELSPEPIEPPADLTRGFRIVVDCLDEEDAEAKYNKIADLGIEAHIETGKV